MPHDAARLHARPTSITKPAASGLQKLDIGSARDSYCYVPPQDDPDRASPLVLLLHGAGGHAHHGLDLLRHLADDHGLLLVAPASTAPTWDVIASRSYGKDVRMLDRALEYMFARYAVDTRHIAIGGFSDGASYALTLGLANGDLFTHIIAFSPGFIASIQPVGQPKIFISHGTKDDVLPIVPCSRKIVPGLQRMEYDVLYAEFDGGHIIPGEVAQGSMEWFFGKAKPVFAGI